MRHTRVTFEEHSSKREQLRVVDAKPHHVITFHIADYSLHKNTPNTSLSTQTSRSDYVHAIKFPRSDRSCPCQLGFSRASRLRGMPSGLFGSSYGLLLCGRLYLGRHARRFRSSNYHRMQYCFRHLSKCMCSRPPGSNTIEGVAMYLQRPTLAN
jgi:hypothetical protein